MHIGVGQHHAVEKGAFDHRAYRPLLIEGKTVCVVGAGGIGREVGRLCAALGMRVVGTRRSSGGALPSGFREIGGMADLNRLLAQSDIVAVCCQWTPETTKLINAERLAAMAASRLSKIKARRPAASSISSRPWLS